MSSSYRFMKREEMLPYGKSLIVIEPVDNMIRLLGWEVAQDSLITI